MAFIGLLKLLMLIFLIVTGIYVSILLIRRSNAVNKVWKIKEPYFRKHIEEETGQKIRETMFLNASVSGDFQRESFMVWLAFTADNMALIIKDAVLNEEDTIVFYRKEILSLKKFYMRIFELEVKQDDPGEENETLKLGIPKKKMEIIRHHIKKIQLTKK